jgi:transketolase
MTKLSEYEQLGKDYRKQLFEKFLATKQGHPGSVFSMMDIAVILYHGGFVRFDSNKKVFTDRVVISKGHATAALYPIMKNFGVLPEKEWENWGQSSSLLRVFGNTSMPGIDVTSGSLGHGVGVGAGMALAAKARNDDTRVYSVISEGELYEGSTWEGLLFAHHHELDNLTIIIDVNNLIILGGTDDCLKLNPIKDKIAGFGIDTIEVNGHDFDDLNSAFKADLEKSGLTCMVVNTVKGKGVSFMENKNNWHYFNPMSDDQIEQARKELS